MKEIFEICRSISFYYLRIIFHLTFDIKVKRLNVIFILFNDNKKKIYITLNNNKITRSFFFFNNKKLFQIQSIIDTFRFC